MSAEAATGDVLNRAEIADTYRQLCAASPANAAARAGQTYDLFSDPDAADIAALARTIPLCRELSATIAILHPSADAGYPHTRPGGLICLPAGFYRSKGREETRRTLLHEAVHLHQRAHPSFWAGAVARDGWTRVSPLTVPFELEGRVRLNPDTLVGTAGLWAWQGISLPLPLFPRDRVPANLGDCAVRWLDLRGGGGGGGASPAALPDPPSSFQARYGRNPPQPEHPFELLAVELSAQGLDRHEDIVRSLE